MVPDEGAAGSPALAEFNLRASEIGYLDVRRRLCEAEVGMLDCDNKQQVSGYGRGAGATMTRRSSTAALASTDGLNERTSASVRLWAGASRLSVIAVLHPDIRRLISQSVVNAASILDIMVATTRILRGPEGTSPSTERTAAVN